MASINSVTILGNLTRDPEIKYLPDGKALCSITLALNENWKSASGDKMESVSFIDVELWGKTAEVAGKYLKKGGQACIQGSLKQDTWEDKATNQKRSKIKVRGDKLTLFGGADKQAPAHTEAKADPLAPTDTGRYTILMDDVPF